MGDASTIEGVIATFRETGFDACRDPFPEPVLRQIFQQRCDNCQWDTSRALPGEDPTKAETNHNGHPDIPLYVNNTKNRNTTIYRATRTRCGKFLDPQQPLIEHWYDIEPSYVEKRRKKGKRDDYVELSFIESSMAYASSSKPIGETGAFKVKFVALPQRPMILRLVFAGDISLPVLLSVINGHPCIVERFFVQSIFHKWSLPTVEWVDFYGFQHLTGKPECERLHNKE